MQAKLICWSDEIHLSQIYAGLTMLNRQNEIDLTQTIIEPPAPNPDPDCPPHLKHATNWHCRLEMDGKSYYIDVHDSDDIDAAALESCDVYLKRGYNPRKQMSPKVRPLGLNYPVFADGVDRFELLRRLKLLGPAAALKHVLKRPITVSEIASAPSLGEPAVLFVCRTWEADSTTVPAKVLERQELNENRAQCIVALRNEFGSRCLAGFVRSPYAIRHFSHAIVDGGLTTERRSYLKLVRSVPICIATLGLHQSTPWKLGEYVANARAIVSEQLHHDVPEFYVGENYLQFRDAAECVATVGALMESKVARDAMAAANRDYYERRLKPDRLILRASQAA